MTEVSFYHLERQSLDEALALLLGKASQASLKAVVRVSNSMLLTNIDRALWEKPTNSFLPHGTKKDGDADQQPIFITEGDDNPASATLLFIINDAEFGNYENYDRVFYIFEGQNLLNVEHARGQWRELRDRGDTLKYWQQSEQGNWQLKAN
jgi:DNA polymerase-3 subunit chi